MANSNIGMSDGANKMLGHVRTEMENKLKEAEDLLAYA
jgi:hypothetical protein